MAGQTGISSYQLGVLLHGVRQVWLRAPGKVLLSAHHHGKPDSARIKIPTIAGSWHPSESVESEMPHDLRHLPKRFGDAVRGARTNSKITQMALAERADLTLNYVGEIERGEKLASIDTVVRIAFALDMTAAELMKKAGL